MRIMFTTREFRAIASTGIAASTDDVTPVLLQIKLSYDAESQLVTVVATDRYRVARNRFPLFYAGGNVESFEILLPAKEITKFWTSVKSSALRSNSAILLDIISGDGRQLWALEFNNQRIGGDELAHANYPPVERLFPDDYTAGTPVQGVSLNMRYVGDLAKIYAASDSLRENLKSVPWQMFTQETESGRPGPVYFTRPTDDGAIVDYLLQPNLIVRR